MGRVAREFARRSTHVWRNALLHVTCGTIQSHFLLAGFVSGTSGLCLLKLVKTLFYWLALKGKLVKIMSYWFPI